MNKLISPTAISGLRQRFVEDMTVRGFTDKTRRTYIRIVSGFAAFLGRSPDTARAEDIRRFQIHQSELGMHAPGMNGTVAALRFFLTQTLDRPDLSRKLIRLRVEFNQNLSQNVVEFPPSGDPSMNVVAVGALALFPIGSGSSSGGNAGSIPDGNQHCRGGTAYGIGCANMK